jgi:hypothetical protein
MFRNVIGFCLLMAIWAGSLGYADGYTPRVGEVLQYKVMVKSTIHGANQTVKVLSNNVYRDRQVVNVRLTMNTIGLLDSMAKYHEKEDLVLDVDGLYPWFIKREVQDGRKTFTEEVTFDYDQGLAVRLVTKDGGSQERSEIKLPGFVQDGLSLQFFFRRCTKGDSNQIYLYANGSVEKVGYVVNQVQEVLKLDCGDFSKYYQVDNKESNITVLVANNQERLPLVIRKMASFGKIEARLSKVE